MASKKNTSNRSNGLKRPGAKRKKEKQTAIKNSMQQYNS